jgi:acid phosphatase family membrane protein YuiD
MYLLSACVGYVVAQTAKMIGFYVKDAKRAKKAGFWTLFMESGGMPSGHSATVMGLASYTVLADGIWAASSGIAVIMAIIVMYDAQKVRRATGEIGLTVNQILKKHADIKEPFYARGHEPAEVVVGAILGLAIGVFIWLISR